MAIVSTAKKLGFIGAHCYFAREQTLSTKTTKPPNTDSKWIDVGPVSQIAYNPTVEEKEIWEPSPGKLRRAQVIEFKRACDFTVSVDAGGPLLYLLLFNPSFSLTACDISLAGTVPYTPAAFSPGVGATLRGWVKIQFYDEHDLVEAVVDLWCRVKITAQTMGAEVAKYEMVCQEIYSTQAAGNLENVTEA